MRWIYSLVAIISQNLGSKSFRRGLPSVPVQQSSPSFFTFSLSASHCDQNVDTLMEIATFGHGKDSAHIREAVARSLTYSPMMQFVLEDIQTREFVVQRWCFLGSVDDWISLDSPNHLSDLVKKYGRHLGKESLYDLMP